MLPEVDGRPTVLVVDDEVAVRETTAALLSEQYTVLTADSAEQALRLLEQHAVTVVCADYQMPGMTGLELLTRLKSLSPPVSGVLVTGYQDLVQRDPRRQDEPFLLLIKPYAPEKLLAIVNAAQQYNRVQRMLKP
jgi:two-component system response regulator HupR/HoxA